MEISVKRTGGSRIVAAFLGFHALVVSSAGAQTAAPAEEISRFGEYAGYGEPVYDGYVRESFYIPMRDGVKLACDLYRPTRAGRFATEPLPLVWTHDRYQRSSNQGGAVVTKLLVYPGLADMIHHGYLVATVDVRGGGASFGNWTGIFNPDETQDAYDIMEWFAGQEWCDGNLGMFGGSYLGGTQFMAAATESPHLRAIFPFVALCDQYDVVWTGGIFRDDLTHTWSELTKMLDRSSAVLPVDGLEGESDKKEALAQHEANLEFESHVRAMPFRDSEHPSGFTGYEIGSPVTYLEEIEESDVAIYHQAGWFDTFPKDAAIMYRSLENPQKMVIGPWFHTEAGGVDWSAEFRRWFDYWLKGVENGVMDEDPIHYYTMGAPRGQEWRSTPQWPLAEERRVDYFFGAGPSGSVKSINDGTLQRTPSSSEDSDRYVVDYECSSGQVSRWNTAVGAGGPSPRYQDQRANDQRSLTYTSPVLEADLEVTGHPVARLWVSSDHDDGDFFVYLQEVTPDGASTYVTEGCLRASHRALQERAGLPFHRSYASDVQPMDGKPVELVIDLQPTSNLFDRGHRIRVTVACADHENSDTPVFEPLPVVQLHRAPQMASRIELPTIPVANVPANPQGE